MATWFIDFDSVTAFTDHFTTRRGTPATLELVTDDGQQTLHVLQGTSTFNNVCFFSFDAAGSAVGDFEIVYLVKPVHSIHNTETTTTNHNAIAGRYDQPSGIAAAYNIGVNDTSGTSVGSIKADSGLNTSYESQNPEKSGIDHWDYLWMRLRVEDDGANVNVYCKIWQHDDTEPVSWDRTHEGTISTLNTNLNGQTGYVGFGGRSSLAEYYIKKIGFATDGDTAPTGETTVPSITSVSDTTLDDGQALTITGENFGSSQNLSTVDIEGVSQTVNTWSDTSVVINSIDLTGLPAGDANVRLDRTDS